MADAPLSPEDAWFYNQWRPAMAWQYLFVCLFDFVFAPILLGIYSWYSGEYHAWEPLSLHGGGLYHLSMGAIVGVTSWSRGKEKMALLNNDDDGGKDKDPDPPHDNDRAKEEGK